MVHIKIHLFQGGSSPHHSSASSPGHPEHAHCPARWSQFRQLQCLPLKSNVKGKGVHFKNLLCKITFTLFPISNTLAQEHSSLFLESPPHLYLLANSNQSGNIYLKCYLFLLFLVSLLCSHRILYIPLSFTQQTFIKQLLDTYLFQVLRTW